MSVRRITKYGEKVLRQKTKPVKFSEIEKKLPHILKDMRDTCYAVKGLGLAANQIGLSLRIAVVATDDEKKPKKFVLINPKITKKSGKTFAAEGCLSLPGVYAKVKRYANVTVTALNEKGLPVEIEAEGLLARAFQHEVDHLNGKFFIDRLSPLAKIKFKSIIKKLKSRWAEIDEGKGIFYEGPFFGDT